MFKFLNFLRWNDDMVGASQNIPIHKIKFRTIW